MTNVNIFTIIGRLTADAEEFTIGNNTYVGFRVAVDRGQNKETSFIPVRAPKKFISDNLRAKLVKGAPVLATGRFEAGSYDKDGQKKYYSYLSAATIQADVSGNFSDGLLMDFHKGDPIMVAGTLSSYSHKNKDGENRTFYTVWADKASFASRGKDTTQNSTPAPAATPASAPAPSAPTYGEYGADEFDAVEKDDLPF